MATATSRTLIKTTNAGWYIDASNPDGPRVRKQDGDTIITREEYEARQSQTPSQQRAAHAAKGAHQRKAERKAAEPTDQPEVKSETGKILRGPTTSIHCQYKGEDTKGKTCGKVRVVKVQDKFQVKYCVPHQQVEHRRRKREKLRARRQAQKAATTTQ